MPKKPPRNAFYFFMLEMMPKLRQEGRAILSIADVPPYAHPIWKGMSDKEKEPYEQMAKREKGKARKLDSMGTPIAEHTDPYEEKHRQQLVEKQYLTKRLTGKDVVKEKFHFIEFQHLCVTEEGIYLPCEIAIIEYSLERGIGRRLHRFIDVERIPSGYRWTCRRHSEDTHQIPVDNFELATNDYASIWEEMSQLVNPEGCLPENPAFFCLGADVKRIQGCLQWLGDRLRVDAPEYFKYIHSLEGLVAVLYEHANKPGRSESLIIDMLTTPAWDYSPNTSCDYHYEKECKYCALGQVRRYAYAISDALSVCYNIDLTVHHLPEETVTGVAAVFTPDIDVKPLKQGGRLPASRSSDRGRGGSGWSSTTVQARESKSEVDQDRESAKERVRSDGERLRRPNVPSQSETLGANFRPVPTAVISPQNNSAEWPGLTETNGRYAGRSAAPDPSLAPQPPEAWMMTNANTDRVPDASQTANPWGVRQEQQPQNAWTSRGGRGSVPMGRGRAPVGRGRAPRGNDITPPGRIGQGEPNPGSFGQQPQGPWPTLDSLPPDTCLLGQGRGRGIVPGQSSPVKPPVGRGHAPPGLGLVTQGMENLLMSKSPGKR